MFSSEASEVYGLALSYMFADTPISPFLVTPEEMTQVAQQAGQVFYPI